MIRDLLLGLLRGRCVRLFLLLSGVLGRLTFVLTPFQNTSRGAYCSSFAGVTSNGANRSARYRAAHSAFRTIALTRVRRSLISGLRLRSHLRSGGERVDARLSLAPRKAAGFVGILLLGCLLLRGEYIDTETRGQR